MMRNNKGHNGVTPLNDEDMHNIAELLAILMGLGSNDTTLQISAAGAEQLNRAVAELNYYNAAPPCRNIVGQPCSDAPAPLRDSVAEAWQW